MVRKLVRPSLKEILEEKEREEKQKTEAALLTDSLISEEDDTEMASQTFREIGYYQELIENKTPLRVTLKNGEQITGFLEYYDKNFIRITRDDSPNAFIFKWDIKYFEEL